jgi:anti-sigma regulatory factor (Ser/Thr protein kinase)
LHHCKLLFEKLLLYNVIIYAYNVLNDPCIEISAFIGLGKQTLEISLQSLAF